MQNKPLTLREIEELRALKAKKEGQSRQVSSSSEPCSIKKVRVNIKSDSLKKSNNSEIVINRMHAGGYLESNLGHKIINLFQADNGRHYLYLNSSGSFACEHRDIDYMLMVKYVGKDTFEVTGLAKCLEIAPGADSPRSLLDICQIQDDENQFSNALAYFMSRPEYRGLWCDFFKIIEVELGKDYQVERESSAKIENMGMCKTLPNGWRIDVLAMDEKNLLVVENKIKSDINTVEQESKDGTNQLDRYVNYINWRISNEDFERKGSFLILCPDCNRPKLKESA